MLCYLTDFACLPWDGRTVGSALFDTKPEYVMEFTCSELGIGCNRIMDCVYVTLPFIFL